MGTVLEAWLGELYRHRTAKETGAASHLGEHLVFHRSALNALCGRAGAAALDSEADEMYRLRGVYSNGESAAPVDLDGMQGADAKRARGACRSLASSRSHDLNLSRTSF